jgi:glycosyltransferase involved in cell wall biosynthesis
MTEQPSVTVLMATYNGKAYLAEQLNSLLAQTYKNWKLLVRDDGSTDDTLEILKSYKAKHSNISIYTNITGNHGACSNFAALFRMAKLDEHVKYAMFCDQDDVWLPDKIEMTLNEMRRQEDIHPGEPVMIYSDLELVNDSGCATGHSLRLKHKVDLKNLVSFNYVLGCTVMINRAMIQKIGKIPKQAVNHDYWIALVASMYHSAFISQKLIRYRQHTQNASGNVAHNDSISARIRRHITQPRHEIQISKAKLTMLNEFYKLYAQELDIEKRQMLEKYLHAYNSGRLQVCYLILKYRMFKKGFFQSLMTFYQVLFFYNRIAEGLWT